MSGPLSGIKVLELAGIGPGPFACMMLADMGADVVRVDRAAAVRDGADTKLSGDLLGRGRRSIGVDLKSPEGVETVLRLVEGSDVLVEGYRPGVAERLGVGPDECLARNPKLVYGRMTGWGQDGPLAHHAGHDLNYIALAGALHHFGRKDQPPTPPINLVGDFGGGGMLLAFGVCAALVERSSSGQGQVIDAAMVDGAAVLMTMFANMALGPRGTNLLDTGAAHYDVYECADGEYISIGSLEPQFYAELRRELGLDGPEWDNEWKQEAWPERKVAIAKVIKTKTRAEWTEQLEPNKELCFAPVLSMKEAAEHPHIAARGIYVERGGVVQPGPAPRFSRTKPELDRLPAHPGTHTDEVLVERGFDEAEIAKLRETGAVR